MIQYDPHHLNISQLIGIAIIPDNQKFFPDGNVFGMENFQKFFRSIFLEFGIPEFFGWKF